MNISAEPGKSGVAPGDALALAQRVATLPRLRLRGFICDPGYRRSGGAAARAQFRVGQVRRRVLAQQGSSSTPCRSACPPISVFTQSPRARLDANALFGARASGAPAS
ncbi:MAG: hypothetical protein IPF60_10815 [Betaproteobacteria bacterium]|nr:hypothetical protein [Betaproteobacteria bacterium]